MKNLLLFISIFLFSTQAHAVLVSSDCQSRVVAAIQAIPNFPSAGHNANIIDQRVILAICTALQQWITQTGTVIPNTLNNPIGQAVQVNLGNGIGATTAPEVIQGLGGIQ